jgi:hypothetical protein
MSNDSTLDERITDDLIQGVTSFGLNFEESTLRHAPDAKVAFMRVIFSHRNLVLVIRIHEL